MNYDNKLKLTTPKYWVSKVTNEPFYGSIVDLYYLEIVSIRRFLNDCEYQANQLNRLDIQKDRYIESIKNNITDALKIQSSEMHLDIQNNRKYVPSDEHLLVISMYDDYDYAIFSYNDFSFDKIAEAAKQNKGYLPALDEGLLEGLNEVDAATHELACLEYHSKLGKGSNNTSDSNSDKQDEVDESLNFCIGISLFIASLFFFHSLIIQGFQVFDGSDDWVDNRRNQTEVIQPTVNGWCKEKYCTLIVSGTGEASRDLASKAIANSVNPLVCVTGPDAIHSRESIICTVTHQNSIEEQGNELFISNAVDYEFHKVEYKEFIPNKLDQQ